MTTSSHLFDANWYLTSPRTPSFLSRISPNLGFYAPMIWIVFKAGCNAMRNQYDGEAWAQSSEGIAHALESVGCRIEAAGMEHFRSLEGPCVFIGNHMSTLETFVLPSMIQPWKDVTFVVKESLLKYPFFGPVLGSREPIVVGRKPLAGTVAANVIHDESHAAELDAAVGGYLEAIRGLSPEARAAGTAWLQGIIDGRLARAAALLPALDLGV